MTIDTCIICGSSENLNTSMTINVDGKEITVKICDKDADTATPKLVKEKYADKKSSIDDIIAKAKELGLEVNIPSSGSGLVIVEKSEVSPEAPPEAPQLDPTILDSAIADAINGSEKDGVLSTSVVDSNTQRIQGVSGGSSNAESHSAYVPGMGQDKLDPTLLEGKVKMESFTGRGGQIMAIPSVRVDQTGTTTVRVSQDVDDDVLQRRFKDMNTPNSAYAVHNCPICKGDGMIKQRGKLEACPKCGGTGLLNS